MAESTWSKNTTFHAFMLSLKRSNQFPHHILILQGRVPRCPGLASRDTALDSRGNIFQWTLCCRGRCLLSPLICKVPQLICLFRGRILPQTGSDIIYRMQAGIKNEVKIHDFTAWPPARPRGRGSPVPGLGNMKCSQSQCARSSCSQPPVCCRPR